MKSFAACIARHKFPKVFSVVTVYSKYGRTLTYESSCQALALGNGSLEDGKADVVGAEQEEEEEEEGGRGEGGGRAAAGGAVGRGEIAEDAAQLGVGEGQEEGRGVGGGSRAGRHGHAGRRGMKRRGKGAAKAGVRGRMEGSKAGSISAIFQGLSDL